MHSEERIALKKFIETEIMKSEDFRRVLGIDASDFKDTSKYPTPSPSELVFSRFYPYKFMKELKDEQETIITVSISLSKDRNKTEIKSGNIDFLVITHHDLMKTDYIMTRIDYINTLIDKTFNRIKNENMINKLQFVDDDEIVINNSFVAYRVRYSFDSFNTTVVKSYVNEYE